MLLQECESWARSEDPLWRTGALGLRRLTRAPPLNTAARTPRRGRLLTSDRTLRVATTAPSCCYAVGVLASTMSRAALRNSADTATPFAFAYARILRASSFLQTTWSTRKRVGFFGTATSSVGRRTKGP